MACQVLVIGTFPTPEQVNATMIMTKIKIRALRTNFLVSIKHSKESFHETSLQHQTKMSLKDKNYI